MCGIIGYTGKRESLPIVVDGLRRLEYRGYDSAGVACMTADGTIEVKRRQGKIVDLDAMLSDYKVSSTTAIGHTRWATHGKPSEENAHPHRSDGIVIVHNGIIENYIDLRRQLIEDGYVFTSETDTEVLCHLINRQLRQSTEAQSLEKAIIDSIEHVRGAFAIAAMSEREPGKIVALRKDSPLVVGMGEQEYFVASDIPAFLSHTRNIVFLEDNEMCVLTPEGASFLTLGGEFIEKEITPIAWSTAMAEKGGFRHFMHKEIYEQPRSIADTITGRILDHNTGAINTADFGMSDEFLSRVNRVVIVACGTSWHAGLVGKYLIEEMARVPVEVDIGSEYRYRNPLLSAGDLFISITQSGETADTLAAQRLAKSRGAHIMTICNVIGSTSSREADSVLYTRSGPEIGVASTKAFTAQLVSLYLFAIALGRARGTLDNETARMHLSDLMKTAEAIEHIVATNDSIDALTRDLHNSNAFLFLGRGINFPIALEGALKLKEISYIHAEGYPAGEMKHGPIALIDEGYPVVVLAPRDELYEKVISNIQEIKSRGGKIILITDEDNRDTAHLADHVLYIPNSSRLVMPILFSVPLQLLAYHIGVYRGCDVDQPRNLAKSVTVE